MPKILLAILSLSVLLAANAYADSVYLKDGKIVRGQITEEDDKTILLETNDTWRKIDKSAIEFIRKDDRQRGEAAAMPPADSKGVPASEKTHAELGKMETILKIAADVAGRHAFSNIQVTGPNTVDRGSSSIGVGTTLTAEEVYYVRPLLGIGAGISYQMANKEPDTQGHFHFIPLYGLVRVRSTPTSDNRYSFATAQLGYNYFIADQGYAGAGKYVMTNGAYAGLGAGYVFGRMQVEVLYTIDQGRFSANGYDSANTPYSVSADATYRKLSLSFGVLF